MIDPSARPRPRRNPGVTTTGRQVIVFADTDGAGVDWAAAGISDVADSRDFTSGQVSAQALRGAGATVFARLGIAVVDAAPDQVAALRAASVERPVLSVSPELVHHVLAGDPVDLLETLCQRLADVCLADPLVTAVEITVHKPQAELGVPFDDVTVSIRRERA